MWWRKLGLLVSRMCSLYDWLTIRRYYLALGIYHTSQQRRPEENLQCWGTLNQIRAEASTAGGMRPNNWRETKKCLSSNKLFASMCNKAEWMGHPMRIELPRVGLLVKLANNYTTKGALIY